LCVTRCGADGTPQRPLAKPTTSSRPSWAIQPVAARVAAIDYDVGPERLAEADLLGCAHGRDHARPERATELDRRGSGTAGTAEDEQRLALAQRGAPHQPDPGGVERDRKRGRLQVVHRLRDRKREVVQGERLLGEAAVAEEEAGDRHDAIAHARQGALPRLDDDTAELLAGREGPRRRQGVGPATHEDVGQPERTRRHAHAQESRPRRGRLDVREHERLVRLPAIPNLPGTHQSSFLCPSRVRDL
jgi:hypothetical protein